MWTNIIRNHLPTIIRWTPPKTTHALVYTGKKLFILPSFLLGQGSTYRSIGIENHVFRWSGLFHQGGCCIDDLTHLPDEQKNTRRSSHPWREISYNIFIKGVIKVYNFYRRTDYDGMTDSLVFGLLTKHKVVAKSHESKGSNVCWMCWHFIKCLLKSHLKTRFGGFPGQNKVSKNFRSHQ